VSKKEQQQRRRAALTDPLLVNKFRKIILGKMKGKEILVRSPGGMVADLASLVR
jgi:hypothetical protein